MSKLLAKPQNIVYLAEIEHEELFFEFFEKPAINYAKTCVLIPKPALINSF